MLSIELKYFKAEEKEERGREREKKDCCNELSTLTQEEKKVKNEGTHTLNEHLITFYSFVKSVKRHECYK